MIVNDIVLPDEMELLSSDNDVLAQQLRDAGLSVAEIDAAIALKQVLDSMTPQQRAILCAGRGRS
jgi:hypothetical protein